MQTYQTTDAAMCQNVSDIPRILPSFVSRPEIAIAIRKFIQRETMHNRQGWRKEFIKKLLIEVSLKLCTLENLL